MDQNEINEQEWRRDANWAWGVYRSARDTRVWVPKRVKWMGWTLNFAHRAACVWLGALLLPSLLILLLLLLIG